MVKKFFLILCIIFTLTSCGSKLNPEWYPHGPGRDTVYTVGNGKFHLGKSSDGVELSMFKDDGSCSVLLAYVNEYEKSNGNVYVFSDEGYCVINENTNTAKVLITVEKQHFSNLVGEDEAITYLTEFDEFDQIEKEKFEDMKNTGL